MPKHLVLWGKSGALKGYFKDSHRKDIANISLHEGKIIINYGEDESNGLIEQFLTDNGIEVSSKHTAIDLAKTLMESSIEVRLSGEFANNNALKRTTGVDLAFYKERLNNYTIKLNGNYAKGDFYESISDHHETTEDKTILLEAQIHNKDDCIQILTLPELSLKTGKQIKGIVSKLEQAYAKEKIVDTDLFTIIAIHISNIEQTPNEYSLLSGLSAALGLTTFIYKDKSHLYECLAIFSETLFYRELNKNHCGSLSRVDRDIKTSALTKTNQLNQSVGQLALKSVPHLKASHVRTARTKELSIANLSSMTVTQLSTTLQIPNRLCKEIYDYLHDF